MPDAKICGLKTPEAMTAAIEGGAAFVGFLFVAGRPCTVEVETAAYLASYVPHTVKTVGVFQDPTDEELDNVLSQCRLDMIQLHGKESPGRVLKVKQRFSRPVMKALSLKSTEDTEMIEGYEVAADWLLFDAPQGGSGQTFDWHLLQQYCSKNPILKPWMLAGGLNSRNIKEALSLLDPDCLDVSSGVESERGIKDPEKVREFLKLAQT